MRVPIYPHAGTKYKRIYDLVIDLITVITITHACTYPHAGTKYKGIYDLVIDLITVITITHASTYPHAGTKYKRIYDLVIDSSPYQNSVHTNIPRPAFKFKNVGNQEIIAML